MNPSLSIVLLCSLLRLTIVTLHAAPLELDTLRQQFHKAAVVPFDTSRGELDTKFATALEAAVVAAKQGGRLDEVIALQEDQKRLAGGIPFPDNDADTPESFARLRNIYREQRTQLDAQRAAAYAEILPAYTGRLKELEATLTKADRISDALAVKSYREGLGKESTTSTAPAKTPALAPATMPPATPIPTAPALAPVPRQKGDDRKAAEWVLSVGGVVEIWDNADQSRPIRSLADLPSGKFSIRKVVLDNNKGGIKPVTDTDLRVLQGLDRLEYVQWQKLAITPAAFDVLQSCPSVNIISLQYNRLGDGIWPRLRGLKLQQVSHGYDELPVEGIGISQLDHESLENLFLASTPVGDAALKELAVFANLAVLGLSETKVTDAGMALLPPLKKLRSLNVFGTDVTVAGLRALEGAPITYLGYGRNMEEFLAQLPEVAVLFPKLKEIHLPREANPTTDEWKAIVKALPVVERFEVRSRRFGDEACDGLALVPKLSNVSLYDAPLTDIGIAKLANAKNLRRIEIPLAKITDISLETLAGMPSLTNLVLPKPGTGLTTAGIEKFKKVRPDVSIR